MARAAPDRHRRNLPHFQTGNKAVYITFCTLNRWVLPEEVRSLVLRHCLHDHGIKHWLYVAVVMPDHVHMILSPGMDSASCVFGLPEIMSGIKGASAHAINRALNRRGSVWQEESFDHVLRSSESMWAKVKYVCDNPVRKGLAKSPEDWPWRWVAPFEGCTAEGGCAT